MTFKIRMGLLGLLTVFAAISVASPAVALPTQGPRWHINNVVLPEKETKNIRSSGGKFELFGEAAGAKFKIECLKAKDTGWIWNGPQHGQDEATVTFEECTLYLQEAGKDKELCPVTINPVRVKSFLWYHLTNKFEPTSKIQDLFEPEQGEVFSEIKVANEAKCGVFKNMVITVKGSQAAEVRPQEKEEVVGELVFPTEPQKYLWQPKNTPETREIGLKVGTHEARFEGVDNNELTSGEKFGAWEK